MTSTNHQTTQPVALIKLVIPVLVAIVLWFLMFSKWTAHYFNFWVAMACSGSILLAMSFILGKDWLKEIKIDLRAILIGFGSAVALWGLFYFGNFFAETLFNFAKPQVTNIYGLRDGNSHLIIAMLLLFVIGPAETFFWQGYVQRNFMAKLGDKKGFFITLAIYALVHIWAFNLMLLLAATVCGAFWGWLYMVLKPRNLVPLIISHSVWDVMVFIIFPIT